MVHLRLPARQSALVPGGQSGWDVAARPGAPLEEAEAHQEGAETRGGGYPHGAVCFCIVIPVIPGGEVLPRPPPPPPPPASTAAGPALKSWQKEQFKSK